MESLDPSILDMLYRGACAVKRAIEQMRGQTHSHEVEFICPKCHNSIMIRRTDSESGLPIEVTCSCGFIKKFR